MVMMMGRTYEPSSFALQYTTSKKSFVLVKLTEQSIKAIEQHVETKGTSSPSILFPSNKPGSQGVMEIPVDDQVKRFNFSLSPLEQDGTQGSVECIQQKRNSKLVQSLGRIEYKLKVQATDESFGATKAKMTAASNEAAKKATKVIKAGMQGRKFISPPIIKPNNRNSIGLRGNAKVINTNSPANVKNNSRINCNNSQVANGIVKSDRFRPNDKLQSSINSLKRKLEEQQQQRMPSKPISPPDTTLLYKTSPSEIPSSSSSCIRANNESSSLNNSRVVVGSNSHCKSSDLSHSSQLNNDRQSSQVQTKKDLSPSARNLNPNNGWPKRSPTNPMNPDMKTPVVPPSVSSHGTPTIKINGHSVPSSPQVSCSSRPGSRPLSPAVSRQDYDRLRKEFDILHRQYILLTGIIEPVTQRFNRLEAKLNTCHEGSTEWNVSLLFSLSFFDFFVYFNCMRFIIS